MRTFLFRLLLCLLVVGLSSCNRLSIWRRTIVADSLNALAYHYHYQNLDSCRIYAGQALEAADEEPTATAQAYNNLAFYAFMHMDFEQSGRYLEKVHASCRNELELLVADVGMMKICQRTSDNKRFYDYRNSALRRIGRISEEQAALSREEQQRLLFARSEFHIVSSIYFFYLQQLPQSLAEIDSACTASLRFDPAQRLYYLYMKGSGGLCIGADVEDVTVREFDYLSRCVAESGRHVYFEANCLQAFAEMLNDVRKLDILKRRREQMLKLINPREVPDSLLPTSLAGQALKRFRDYGDIYQIAGAYRTLGACLIRRGRYAEAVDSLQRALDYVTYHHYHYYACTDPVHHLEAFHPQDTVPLELQWMNDRDVQTVPEWIARIREQLSIAYAGMGMKEQSDYNRNIYLDILDVTRQDKELESRYDRLERDSAQLRLWLSVVVTVVVVVSVLFVWLNRRWRRNNALQVDKLQRALEFCRRLLAVVPREGLDKEEVSGWMVESVQFDFEALFGCRLSVAEGEKGEVRLVADRCLPKDERALLEVIRPYLEHAIRNARYFAMLGGERRQLEKEKYIHEQHIVENKRQNIVKKSCVAIVTGIVPYIDRIINEVHKLLTMDYPGRPDVKPAKYRYIDELATRINEYNEILALWIRMKQGSLSLNIETFALEELFDILAKGRKAFESKRQSLDMVPTAVQVKADKALTLFMINTLMENARKYTPVGGRVKVEAVEKDDYVEISVTDNGRGLSSADVGRIMREKIYDPSVIGMTGTAADEELRQNKGSGFGLMNCKGIIEKYRKTNALFRVCLFAVESEPGRGSRFYFRLPRGARKVTGALLCVLALHLGTSCHSASGDGAGSVSPVSYYDAHLKSASAYADSVYFCNVRREHDRALAYADSALHHLNLHYGEHARREAPLMTLSGMGDAAEISWWNTRFDTDYYVILDIRNEVAVAALALKDWDMYRYNNTAYTYLYKLLGRDVFLEKYCTEMERSSGNTFVSIILCVVLSVVFLAGYYLLYFRHRMLYRFNLEQLLLVNQTLLSASTQQLEADADWRKMWKNLLREAFDGMNDLLPLQSWGIAVRHEESRRLESVFYPILPAYGGMTRWMEECFDSQAKVCSADGCVSCFPLLAEWTGTRQCLGVLVIQSQRKQQTGELLLLELMARYVGILLMNNTIRVGQTFRDLELVRDDKARARREANILHVQNLVLDNCLSTIKHETLYYPNRIKQIADRLLSGIPADEENRQVGDMRELASYYKDVFTLLSMCAVRQLDEVTFRRQTIRAVEVADGVQKQVRRRNRKVSFALDLQVHAGDERVVGDKALLDFLFENLLDVSYAYPASGRLLLQIGAEDDFVRFSLTDSRRTVLQEELDNLFYPDLARMKGPDGRLTGTEYLICKQIIREHDEFTGKRGCRIDAESVEGMGFTVWFTIPRSAGTGRIQGQGK